MNELYPSPTMYQHIVTWREQAVQLQGATLFRYSPALRVQQVVSAISSRLTCQWLDRRCKQFRRGGEIQFGNRLLQNAEQNVDTLGDHIMTLEELQESLLDMDTESDIGLGIGQYLYHIQRW